MYIELYNVHTGGVKWVLLSTYFLKAKKHLNNILIKSIKFWLTKMNSWEGLEYFVGKQDPT